MAKSKRQKLIKQMDGLCLKIIRIRDDDTCQRCLKKVYGYNSHPSHVIPKSVAIHLRHDLLNLKLLCYHCHIFWWHKDPIEARRWFVEHFLGRHNYLCARRHDPRKDTITDLENRRDMLKEKLAELKGE